MKILLGNDIDRTEWSRLVQNSSTGTWFQTPEAYDFFASMPELFMPFVIGIANDPAGTQTHLRAICVGYVTVEKNPVKQFFTRRAIIIGGPVLADDCTDEEVIALMSAVKNLPSLQGEELCSIGLPVAVRRTLLGERLSSPIYIETRNFNDYSRWKGAFSRAGFEYQPHLNFHVDCTDKEAIWERLSDNRKRQVRHTMSEGVNELMNEGVSEQNVREWYQVLEHLYRTKVKTPLWPVKFFIEAHRQGVGRYMLVRHEGKIIGGSMTVADEKAVYEWFECGLNAQYKDQYPSVCATYAGMRYAAENGIARYDMMGAGEPGVPYGVRDFKAEFGGKKVEHGRFLYVAKPSLYKIGTWGVRILKRI